ncbi:MAG: AsnC family transcriptional regulator [Nitrospinota bacterium]|nr:AsnC family transcriptional regulator [Nitrospinota bacterium]
MDDIDKKILNMIQTGFPVESRPYKSIGATAGVSEEEAFGRVKAMVDSGVIRRIGASFDSRGLGWTSTLCAMKTPPARIEEAAAVISAYPGVTHNYERAHEFNLWFTLIAPDEEAVAEILGQIERKCGMGPVYNMPMIKKFKIKVDFKFKEGAEEE